VELVLLESDTCYTRSRR